MTELERFAAAVLGQWRAQGGGGGGPIAVSALLDRVLPYRAARRILAIDVSEDYEAMVLRLVAEEDGLARVEPVEAADMAKATIGSKLPDLDVLQLLRSATVTISDRVVPASASAAPARSGSRWAAAEVSEPVAVPVQEAATAEQVTNAPPLDHHPVPQPGPSDSQVTPEEAPMFADHAAEHCWSCGDALPVGRQAKYCPFCGADQRAPVCAACSGPVERAWKHCPDCGERLWSRGDG